MYKLTILFYQKHDQLDRERFMLLAEKMPGLRREIVSDVDEIIFSVAGRCYNKINEFYFDSRAALNVALQSEEGQDAGAWLHEFTSKRFSMVVAEHKEALREDFARKTEE